MQLVLKILELPDGFQDGTLFGVGSISNGCGRRRGWAVTRNVIRLFITL